MHNLHVFQVHVDDDLFDTKAGRSAHQVAIDIVCNHLDEVAEGVDVDDDGNEYSTAEFDYYVPAGAIDVKTELAEGYHDSVAAMFPDQGPTRGECWMQRYGSSMENMCKAVAEDEDHPVSIKELLNPHSELLTDSYTDVGFSNINCTENEPPTHLVLIDFHS